MQCKRAMDKSERSLRLKNAAARAEGYSDEVLLGAKGVESREEEQLLGARRF